MHARGRLAAKPTVPLDSAWLNNERIVPLVRIALVETTGFTTPTACRFLTKCIIAQMPIPPFILRNIMPKGDLGDAAFAWFRHCSRHRRLPKLRNPRLFNDHLYRIKVDGTLLDPLRQFVSDKEYVKIYIGATVGEKYTCKTLRILRNRRDVANYVPNRLPCILKPTHASGLAMICTTQSPQPDREVLLKWLKLDYYAKKREQNYRNLTPKIIVEEFFSVDGTTPPPDYKMFCFGGIPKLIQVDSNRFSNHTRNLYDTEWKLLPFCISKPNGSDSDKRPVALAQMLDIAARLAVPFPFIRVDMYAVGDEIKVGELTNCPEGGAGRVIPPTAELDLGNLFSNGV